MCFDASERFTISSSLFAALVAAACLIVPSVSHAQFDWGSDCSGGEGSFDVTVPTRATLVLGTIPAGRTNVMVELTAARDLDVVLVDVATGDEIVAWPSGLLAGRSEACAIYAGASYCYSGYDGDQTFSGRGNEWIRVDGETNRELEMRVFGFLPGDARVDYSWEASRDCESSGSGEFAQQVSTRQTVLVGEIPAGLSNVTIELAARGGADVDIVLRDGSLGVVSWPSGLLNGATEERTTYGGVTVVYSGYNGIGGDRGFERIELLGTLDVPLTMHVFGYQAGFADLTYTWGDRTTGGEGGEGGEGGGGGGGGGGDSSTVDEFNGPTFSLPLSAYWGPAVGWWFEGGSLVVEPQEFGLWLHNTTGPGFSMPMTGDFRVTSTVLTRQSDAPWLWLDRHYQFAGVMIRDPASNLDFNAENWVFSVVGHRGTYTAIEHKDTYEGLSTVTETPWVGSDAELRICRVGPTIILLERPLGSPTWLFAQEYERPDLPATLEAGLVAYSWTDEFDMRASFEQFEVAPVSSYSDCFDD